MAKIDIAIPCHSYNGRGAEVLEYSFERIFTQTFKDFRVVISDHSEDDKIQKLCTKWEGKFPISYNINNKGRGIIAANLNNLLLLCDDAPWIFWLDQDDYMYDNNSLAIVNENLDDNINWIATSYYHTHDRFGLENLHEPSINPWLSVTNTIGTMSCVTIRNVEDMPQFDEFLRYSADCDFYARFMEQYGEPKLVKIPTICNFLWPNSTTSMTVDYALIHSEMQYVLAKKGYRLE